VILYLTLGLCSLGAAALVYRYDLYDREPPAMIAFTVGLGAGAMALAGRLEAACFARLETDSIATLALVGAGYEEALKLLVVALLALLARSFNDPMDGLIYGSMSGLGMALEEGIAVLRAMPSGGGMLPPEELVRLCGHLVMGGIGGFGVGCLFFRGWQGMAGATASFLSAVLLHFGWDVAALRAEAATGLGGRESLLAVALMLAGLLLYGRLVVVGSRWSQQVFAPGPPQKLWRL
jgi:RsiW-degrading membrane proteinase PrsW (M82 family)